MVLDAGFIVFRAYKLIRINEGNALFLNKVLRMFIVSRRVKKVEQPDANVM